MLSTHLIYLLIIVHHNNIRMGADCSPIASHFRQAGHNVSALKYIGIKRVQKPLRGGDFEGKLLQCKCFWIYTLNTLLPFGLNEEFDIKPFL